MFTNVDVRGVPRGPCSREQCVCDGFTRPCPATSGDASSCVHSGWCCYCGHPPVNHSRTESNGFGSQEIFPVTWNGARPPAVLPTREWNGMLKAAQPTTDEVVVLEPDEEVREAAAPENETPEVIVLPAEEEQSDQNLGLKRKCCGEDAPSLDASTFGNRDLLQKVADLEYEIEELKKRQNEEGMLSTTVATLVELVKKIEQLLPQQASGLEDNSSETSPKESASKRPRQSSRSSKRNRQRRGAANSSVGRRVTNDSSLVKIGEGVTLNKKQMEKLCNMPNLTATMFVRQLCLAVFTTQELQGKCLKKADPSDNREVLDPIRLNAIIDYSCAKFGASRSRLRMVISYVLQRVNKGHTVRSCW